MKIKRWVCTECGDLVESGCTHPPRVCEVCDSILPFKEVKDRKRPLAEVRPVRVIKSHAPEGVTA